jgi:nucleoside-diphosphate-sugar epimerase
MCSVLITGVTGFVGSHIAENLIANNIEVIGLKRKTSDIWRCKGFADNIKWVEIDENGFFKNQLEDCSFEIVIHTAWVGVESNSRDDWNEQSKNISFLVTLLEVSKNVGVKKFIFLGSQAEYGNVEGKIYENIEANALNAYGSIKLACLEIVKTFCIEHHINWIWLRLFSLFGEKENQNWLIPSLVKSIMETKQMDFTLGEQQYSYLYVKDFALIMNKIVTKHIKSGIYNVSSNQIRTIRSMIEDIRDYINPEFILNFGVLNYRKNQSMYIEGDINKLCSQIGEVELTDYKQALYNSISYYLINKN